MSWDSYIDTMVAYSQKGEGFHLDTGCIIGTNGAKWTTDGHPKALKITPEQAVTVATAFSSKKFDDFYTTGLTIEGVKYNFLRADEGEYTTLNAKKKDFGAIYAQNTKSAIVIGHCPEGQQAGQCATAVGKICDYLTSVGM